MPTTLPCKIKSLRANLLTGRVSITLDAYHDDAFQDLEPALREAYLDAAYVNVRFQSQQLPVPRYQNSAEPETAE